MLGVLPPALCAGLASKALLAHSYEQCTPARCCFPPRSSLDQATRARCESAYGVVDVNNTLATFPLALALHSRYDRELLQLSASFFTRANFPSDTWWKLAPIASTSKADALFLYALIRHLKPRFVLEAGTFIGTTSQTMAEAMRANAAESPHLPPGRIVTIDMDDNYVAMSRDRDIITPLHNRSSDALSYLLDVEQARGSVDFVFWDASIFPGDLEKLHRLMRWDRPAPGVAFCLHDFTYMVRGHERCATEQTRKLARQRGKKPGCDKGNEDKLVVDRNRLWRPLLVKHGGPYQWAVPMIPGAKPYVSSPDESYGLEERVATLLPTSTLRQLLNGE